MKSLKVMAVALCAGIVVSGCNNLAKGTAIGAAGGAALGAIIGKIAGNTAVGAAVGTAVGAGTGALIGKHMDKVKAQAAAVENAKVDEIEDANDFKGVKVTFDSGILFATNSSTLSASATNCINQIAAVLNQNKDVDVAIFGHTDSTGSDAINDPLSLKRAQAVEKSLKSKNVSNIKRVEGQGSHNPVADNSTAEGKKQNRRVEVYMYASKEMVEAAEAGTLN
jgi:outer membrane protein OmpA-like peptidoglycan-associated protein